MNRIDGPLSAKTEFRRKWVAANMERMRATNLKWREKNRARLLHSSMERYYGAKFGISVADKAAMVAAAGGKCAICIKVLVSRKDSHLDHDHATGKIRGILCGACNRRLGWYEHNQAAVNQYLT